MDMYWETSCAFDVVAIEKGAFGSPATAVAKSTYLIIIIIIDIWNHMAV